MLLQFDENNSLNITEKAFHIKEFRELYKYYYEQLKRPERGEAAFGILYWMYHFDSDFIFKYPDEAERLKHVKAFVYKGNEVTDTKVFRAAKERYKSLMAEDQTNAYIVMKKNFIKLREYASRITLAPVMEDTSNPDYNPAEAPILVDYKEFSAVNSLLPKQEEELRKYKEALLKHMSNAMDIYGGGTLGAYE